MPTDTAPTLGPTRYRAPLPEVAQFPRVGRLRLGEAVATGRQNDDGDDLFRPRAVDYFRVVEDESGVTSSEAAAAFHRAYGDQPREIKIQLVGATPEAMIDYAWRRYGGSRLQRRCEGPGGQCSIRLESGTWRDGACQCDEERLPLDHKKRCEPNFTFQFLLPDVAGVGVWDLASKSVMSRDAILGFLQLMTATRGSIALLECTMRVVMKPGKMGSPVPTVDLQAFDATPREMIAAAKAPRAELERGDDHVETTIQAAQHDMAPTEGSQPAAPTGAASGSHERPEPGNDAADSRRSSPASAATPGKPGPAGNTPPAKTREEELAEIRRVNVEAQIRFLGPDHRDRLKALCDHRDVRPTRDGLIAAWGARAEDLPRLITELEQEAAGGQQASLDDDPVEEVEGEVVDQPADADDGIPF